MNRKVFIYGLVDPTTNQLRYVGKSVNPVIRLRKHISDRNLHDSYKDRWLRKLYENNLKPELIIIDAVKEEDWQYWEIFYILYFKSIGCILTNGTKGGDEPPLIRGWKHTEEAKLKMSRSKKGKTIPWLNNGIERTQEHRNNLSKSCKGRVSPNKGKTFSDEYRKKLSEAHIGIQARLNHPMYGKTHSMDTKNKISKCLSKPVFQFTLDDIFLREFESVKEAEKETGIPYYTIRNICLNKKKSNDKFKWKYNR